MATRIIGIDFGTSTTVVRVHNVGAGNRIVPVTVNGLRTIPTIAFRPQDSGDMYYGYDAEAKIASNQEGTIFRNFKMDLISEDDAKRAEAEKLIKDFLRYVYNQYQGLLNDGVFDQADDVKVYVSHPAKWTSTARSLMKDCVVNAGFCSHENVLLKDEPTAAFLAVMHEKNEQLKRQKMLFEGQEYKAMMIDMGAGTTDIVLCSYKIEGGKLEIMNIFTYPSINTPGLCGGREIDDAIVSAAEEFVNNMQCKPTATGKKTVELLRRRVKTWKEMTVSVTLREESMLPEPFEISQFRNTLIDFGAPVKNETERFAISREYFETFTAAHWQQWAKLISGAFQEVSCAQYADLECPKSPEEVDLVILTGGHSQWYVASEYILGKLKSMDLPDMNFSKIRTNPQFLIQSKDPQETVAVGLCHLDEDVVGAIAASNSVSITFACEGRYMGACDLVTKGTPLPYVKNDFLITNSINGNFIYKKSMQVEYSIITDKVNTINKVVTVPSDGILEVIFKLALALIGVSIFKIPAIIVHAISGEWNKIDSKILDDIINSKYDVKLSPKISVNEEGIITVGGKIQIDDESITMPETII